MKISIEAARIMLLIFEIFIKLNRKIIFKI